MPASGLGVWRSPANPPNRFLSPRSKSRNGRSSRILARTVPRSLPSTSCSPCWYSRASGSHNYRGIVQHLSDSPHLAPTIYFQKIPHLTTRQKVSQHLLKAAFARTCWIKQRIAKRDAACGCPDLLSTPLDWSASRRASAYFEKRHRHVGGAWKSLVDHRYPKMVVLSDVDDHFILAYQVRHGPTPHVNLFEPLLDQPLTRMRITAILADASLRFRTQSVVGS